MTAFQLICMKTCEPLLCCTKCDTKVREGEESRKTRSVPEVRQHISPSACFVLKDHLFKKSMTDLIDCDLSDVLHSRSASAHTQVAVLPIVQVRDSHGVLSTYNGGLVTA